ncbi:hypothetical protein Zmor_007396 [Zophobas morio]|uniref:Tyr recombinase domain-containing protein n=1 Tax=Zophobas morio TaxID=2755281 RepID=A0AA38IZL0_9CUCU|nr:hypothetical protein Zmor_007396 [Zophobas morio]
MYPSSFRRTYATATNLAEKGMDLLSLKRHGEWKSSSIAEGYNDGSIFNKKKIAEIVQSSSTANQVKPNRNHDSFSLPSTSSTLFHQFILNL